MNLRIHELTSDAGAISAWEGPVDYACECAGLDCRAQVSLEAERFAEITATPGLFLVAPGHYDPYMEIVEQEMEYAIVRIGETVGERVTPR